MFSPPGLNINTNLQANEQFFDQLSPSRFNERNGRSARRNQKISYQKEEKFENYYDDEINRNLFGNEYSDE